ncbi:23S rRNA (adenine 2030-N6)-methyltransferase [Novimethylophilus kurashikiensis]|uniref:Ribosomal RNA large subunit methyltransferase J n=1 Tax=Novimethylophilus kurashikiensis TaxID=1825523 RepID=A0A2R5F411_9PROT|nr:23S rRNA (adenine(2030)-N(6))-methyltransferase RlmJ [Novimethylophilus kurashikiensis]GBG12518.1 23S rRNA (adenine 2030-N6)-methyltransferase [Novimethylophilus kurashikiensis]
MLSYRHAFHAGNHADVLKHFLLLQLMQYLNQKDKPYWVVDTHAGAGLYALDEGYAAKNAEYTEGIARLMDRDDLPPVLAEYVELVRGLNADGGLKLYPGSPWVEMQALREEDRLRLFELHPTDADILHENFSSAGRRVKIEQTDGFAGLKAVLPPPPRRGLVLIDPPYEEKQDYQRVPAALQDALKRFATGIYAVWYPLLQRPEPEQMIDKLKQLPVKSWLNVSLTVQTPAVDGFGMYGSGMFVVNPPWTMKGMLEEVMPRLVEMLGLDEGAGYTLEGEDA